MATNASIIFKLISIAISEDRTVANIATPCSVNA